MSLSEFGLIERFFASCGASDASLILGVGDDAALLSPPPGRQLALTQDTLVEGVHFLANADPADLGHKALAVNLSDLAAMGAEPAWATLGLTLPRVDAGWLEAFSSGLCALARAVGLTVVGGDTTQGPLAVSIAALGLVPSGAALRRDGARPGDLILVSGTLGDAGLALRLLKAGGSVPQSLARHLHRPQARLALGRALVGRAHAAIDLSDGLAADLRHMLVASGVGATLELERLPLSPEVAASGDWSLPLSAGDDYELCFCLPPEKASLLNELERAGGCRVTQVGRIEALAGLRLRDPAGRPFHLQRQGYEHFT